MVSKELKRFYDDNPLLYGPAGREDLEQLSSILELYPESVRLLSDREAVELPFFECQRCGRCCARVKYVTVSHKDVKRWVSQRRPDIIDSLVIDGRRRPLMAARGKKAIEVAKAEARSLLQGTENEHIFEILYLTALVECAVYVKRNDGACAFLIEDGGAAACSIHDTRPRVCEKFPYYMGRYTDRRLLKEDSFCPELREIAKKGQKK
jgi:Fe-S-cluster containining protein